MGDNASGLRCRFIVGQDVFTAFVSIEHDSIPDHDELAVLDLLVKRNRSSLLFAGGPNEIVF